MARRILVADDSVTIRKVVELTFHDTDILVESVGTGLEALERIEQTRPDLVLADVVMPEPTGYEVCRSVKRSERPVPVLLLTGTFEPFDPERERECGADGHVVKPFESRALLERVREMLARPVVPAPGPEDTSPQAELEEALHDAVAEWPEAHSATSAPVSIDGSDPLDVLLGTVVPEPVDAEPAWPVSVDRPGEDPDGSDALARDEDRHEPGSGSDVLRPVFRSGDPHLVSSEVGLRLSSEDLDAIVRAVVERLSESVIREIAWAVIPELAESLIRQRIREIEQSDPNPV